jgi:hypothetical protein
LSYFIEKNYTALLQQLPPVIFLNLYEESQAGMPSIMITAYKKLISHPARAKRFFELNVSFVIEPTENTA